MSQGKLHPDVAAAAELINRLERPQLLQLVGVLLGYVAGAKAEQLSKAELRLRAAHLAAEARPARRGEHPSYGRVICPVCAKEKQSHGLTSHILRRHHDHLVAMGQP